MTTAKNVVFIFLLDRIDFCGEGGMSKFLAGEGDSPHPHREENPIYIYILHILHILYILYIYTYTYIKELCQPIFIYNEEARCNHIHHVPKWPSYLCKI